MHTQAFLKTFWRMELRPQIFVAMDFSQKYKEGRFDQVIAPAIKGIKVGDTCFEAYRVDISKSGDSILTDIVDGIAHSQLVLADVSIIGKDAVTSNPYRNGNVMYEVGVALACRHSSEVLLVHDGLSDKEKFLFDVSTIPHKKIDFTDIPNAIKELQEALLARLNERQHLHDARVQLAVAGLSIDEVRMLRSIAQYSSGQVFYFIDTGRVDFSLMASLPRLLDKQIIALAGEFEEGQAGYVITQLGKVVIELVSKPTKKFKAAPKPEANAKSTS
ncbi:MAG: hypothetical protein V1721_07775 [Pseudomonadota bacterium]